VVQQGGMGRRAGRSQHPQRWVRGWGVRGREDRRSEVLHAGGGREVNVCWRRCQQRKDAGEVLQSSVAAVGERCQWGAGGRVVERVHNALEARQDQIIDKASGIVSSVGNHERVSLVSQSHKM
jgi:hypothetical protein